MLSPFDDYPIHQTSLSLAHPASGDPNHYDRFFFNGYSPDGEWYFGIAMGLYPNREVIDASFSVVHDGVQRSVFASGRAPADPSVTRVGPISIDVVEPLRVNRVRVDAAHLGIEADVVWETRTPAMEEARQLMVDGNRTIMDVTRLVQWGRWSGEVTANGGRIAIDGLGTKDRSWGIRPLGEPVPGAPGAPVIAGGFFLMWAPVHFDDECTHLILFERPDGGRWSWSGFRVPLLRAGEAPCGAQPAHFRSASYDIRWRPGTRWAAACDLSFEDHDGTPVRLSLEPVLRFQMKGIGYQHPQWAHGRWHGEAAEGADAWKLDGLDPLEFPNLHVQHLCRVVKKGKDEKSGIGVLEQIVLGPHAPSGFRDFMDGADA